MVIRRRTGWTGHIAPRALLAVLAAVGLLASGCSSDSGLKADEAATVGEGSEVEYAVDGGTWTTQAAGGAIPDGAQVRSSDEDVSLTFRGGRIRLGPDAEATLTNDVVTLERGEALVASRGNLSAAFEDTTVGGAATYRIASGLAARVGVYRGKVTVARPAQQRSVPALRELNLADFRLAARPSPLHYVSDDAWDRDLLGDAIAFDGEAARLSRGMELELGTKPLPGRFYGRFTGKAAVPALSRAAEVTKGKAFGPPSDVLLTFFVADAAGSSLAPTIRDVAALRSAGARWGLIALDLGVPADDVVAAIDKLDNRELALADLKPDARTPDDRSSRPGGADAAADTAGVAGTPTTSGTSTTGAGGDVNTGGGSDPAPPGDGGGETPPGGGGGDDPDPPPPTDDSPLGVVDDVAEEVDRVGGERNVRPPTVDETVKAVGDIVDLDD